VKHVAFLRAINVGGRTVKMEALRRSLGDIGLANVETVIASGNVLFDSSARSGDALAKRIEKALAEALGFEVATFVRSAADVRAIAARRPFGNDAGPGTVYVALLKSAPDQASARKILGFASSIDEFRVHEREVYWLCRKKMLESAFSGALLEKTIGMPATLRNVNTMVRIAERVG
jgi:uncharacterized protein (DUF1697 family)